MSEYKIDYCHHDSVTAESRQEYIKREDVDNVIAKLVKRVIDREFSETGKQND